MTNKTASSLNSPLIPTVPASNYGALSVPHDNEALLSPPLAVKNRQAVAAAARSVPASAATANDSGSSKPSEGLAKKLGRMGFYGTSVAVQVATCVPIAAALFLVPEVASCGLNGGDLGRKAVEKGTLPIAKGLGYLVGAPVGAACYVLGAIGTPCYQGCCQSAPTAKLDAQDLPAPPQQTMA